MRCHLILENNVVVEKPINLTSLSRKLVDKSVEVIRARARDERPFLLYHSFAHTHTPLFTEDRSIFGGNIENLANIGFDRFGNKSAKNKISTNKNVNIFGCFCEN